MELPIANRETATRIVRVGAMAVWVVVLTLPVLAQPKPRCQLPETDELPEAGLPELAKAERLCRAVMPDSRSRCDDFMSELAVVEEPSLDQALALAFGRAIAARQQGYREVHNADLLGREVLKPFVDAAPKDPMLLKALAFFHTKGDMHERLLRRALALDPACSSAALWLGMGYEEDAAEHLTHGYEQSEGMWKLLFAFVKYQSVHFGLAEEGPAEAEAFRAQVAADLGSRYMLLDADETPELAERALWRQVHVLDRFIRLGTRLDLRDEEGNRPADRALAYVHSEETWELLVASWRYESLRRVGELEKAEAFRAQVVSDLESRPTPLDAENRAQSLSVLCDGSALKLRMEERCKAAVQELVASDRQRNLPLGADVLEAIDSLNGAAEDGDFEEDARHHEHFRKLLEAEPEEHRSAEFYVVYSRVLRPTAGFEAEAEALRSALGLDPRSGEIGLYLAGALKRLGRPAQEIEAVYRHLVANADDRSAKNMPADHYVARATRLLDELSTEDGSLLTRDLSPALQVIVFDDSELFAAWAWAIAEQGDGDASLQYRLGSMYVEGSGGAPKDDHQAVFWFREAADQGYASAQLRLGFMYANGKGVPVDGRQAEFWYRKTAEQGNGYPHSYAQYELARLYDKGEIVPEDNHQAAFWYRKAAEQGILSAQANLGAMYFNGEGVAEDKVQAYAWIWRAALRGHEGAQRHLALLPQHMTSTQLAAAREMSRRLGQPTEVGSADSASTSGDPVLAPAPSQGEVE